jgi:hypothetical protein
MSNINNVGGASQVPQAGRAQVATAALNRLTEIVASASQPPSASGQLYVAMSHAARMV